MHNFYFSKNITMKILKYIFFLLILALIGVVVFISTQKSTFTSSKSIYIKLPREMIFSYINDYRNWEQWESWKEDDASMKFTYLEKTIGKGASYSWSGADSNGKSTTTSTTENENIAMNVNLNGNVFNSILELKDTLSGTKVTWKSDGKVSFFTKISASLSGGIKTYFDNIFERSLNNLNAVLTREINNFKINVNGIVTIPARYFVKSTITCKPEDLQTNVNVGLSKIKFFFKNNNVKMNGKPFVIKEFESKDSITVGIYGPLKEEIFISEGSDLASGHMEGFSALKATLIGDYSHIEAARIKLKEDFNAKQLNQSATILPMDVYFTTIDENKSPSKWVTFLQIPIYVKPIVVPKKYKPKPKETENLEEIKVEEPKTKEPIKEEF